MMLQVIYNNDKHDMVKSYLLDSYITSGKIRKFKRSDGWVTVGEDMIRGKGGAYEGPDRRTPLEVRTVSF